MERGREVSVERGPGLCPFCRQEVAAGDELVACGACGARHHAACHAEHGRCAACGSDDALVRRAPLPAAIGGRVDGPAPAPAAAGRVEPLRASKITIRREGDVTHLEWDGRTGMDIFVLVALVASCVLAPLALWVLLRRQAAARLAITFEPDAIELPASFTSSARRRLARSDIDQVQVREAAPNVPPALLIDAGAEQLHLVTAATGAALGVPELHWLKRVIDGWRASGKAP